MVANVGHTVHTLATNGRDSSWNVDSAYFIHTHTTAAAFFHDDDGGGVGHIARSTTYSLVVRFGLTRSLRAFCFNRLTRLV